MKNNKQHFGIDQYGNTYFNLGKHPRKELMERIGSKHITKMWRDYDDGSSKHIGYVVGGLWIELFTMKSIADK